MGFFAVLGDAVPNPLTIEECHLNLWVLHGILGRRLFFLDVGLRLSASAPIGQLQVAVPCGASQLDFEDLQDRVLQPTIAQLLFARHVIIAGRTIDYGKGQLEVLHVPKNQARREEAWSDATFSMWTLRLEPGIQPGRTAYVRFRFGPVRPGRVWTWKRSGLGRNGALFDIRICDAREAWSVSDGDALAGRFIPILQPRVFLIAPAVLQLKATSPATHYMRMLEGRPWQKYLGRATSVLGHERFIIYQWRTDSTISDAAPFRVFADLSNEFGLLRFGNYLRIAVVLAFLLIAAEYVRTLPRGSLMDWVRLQIPWRIVGGLSVSGLALWLFRNTGRLQAIFAWLRRALRAVEGWYFKLPLGFH